MRSFILGVVILMAVPEYAVGQQADRSERSATGRTAVPREDAVQAAPARQADRRAERRGETSTPTMSPPTPRSSFRPVTVLRQPRDLHRSGLVTVLRQRRNLHRSGLVTVLSRFPIASTGGRGKETEITSHAIDARTAERTSCSFHTLRPWWSSAKSWSSATWSRGGRRASNRRAAGARAAHS